MTIQQCIYVLKIAESGSFNEAAKQLFIAQPSLSSSIKQLESELNIKIFERSKHGVFLTNDGAEFIRYAGQLVEQNKFITERYQTNEESRKLYVSTQHYDFVADIFGKLLSENIDSKYKFSLKETQTYNVIKDVETAYSDIGIMAVKESDLGIMERFFSKKGISFYTILKTTPHVFLRKLHPLSERKKLNYVLLDKYPYVSYEQGLHNSSFFTEELSEKFNTDRHVEISDRASLMNVLLTTDCYTIGTGIMTSVLNGGNIISIPLESDEIYNIGYIKRIDRKNSPLTQKFIDMLTNFNNQYKRTNKISE